ncbi:MAG TPA: hypothetical protein VLK84_26225 [Longimicrobium sp.]|nr:hypothetical protein [Longimicrobium sp.]
MLLEFVAVYARLEYALKRVGRATEGRDGKVNVAWEGLLTELAPHFRAEANATVRDAVQYIAENPPRREVFEKHGVRFAKVPAATVGIPLKTLVDHVRRTRNNLFHGGKFPLEPVSEPARNERLLHSGVIVLIEIIHLCRDHVPDVYHAFSEDLT